MTRKVLRGVMWALILGTIYFNSYAVKPVNNEVTRLAKDFEREIGVSTKGVTFYFSEIWGAISFPGNTVIGRCVPFFKIVELKEKNFTLFTELEKKALVYHELGHCVCGVPFYHVSENKRVCGSSLMGSVIKSTFCLKKNWNLYIEDLKARCK